jgi:cytosine/adenosine deaminase-related metal-dependent hydrolase
MKRREFLSSAIGAAAVLAASEFRPSAEGQTKGEKAQARGEKTTKISAKFIVGYLNGTHVVYKNACLVYQGDTIRYIGGNYEGKVDRHIDAKNAIVSPGFIDLDALGDIDHWLVSTEGRTTRLGWHKDYFPNRREFMTPEEEAFKTLYAYAQLISNGITTIMPITSALYKRSADTYEETVAAAENAGRLGLRAYLGQAYISAQYTVDAAGKSDITPMHEDGRKGFESAVRFAKKYHGAYNGLIRAALKPERIELQTEELLKDSKAMARELGCPIRLHAAQGGDYQVIQRLYGKSPIAYLNSIGFLDENTSIPHVIVASGNGTVEDKSDDDQIILRDTKTTVIHCPLVFGRGGGALVSFGRYRRLGINMAMGTDTFPPDMIYNLQLGTMMARRVDRGGGMNSNTEFFNAATLGGARALGRDDIGRLAVGAKADIIIIDLNRFEAGVHDDPIATIFLQCTGRDVKTVVIDGRIVMENRVIPNFDYEGVVVKAQAYYEKMRNSWLERAMTSRTSDEVFTYSYPLVK